MTDHAVEHHRAAPASGLEGLKRLFRNWQARRKVRGMEELDDRMLADIGVTRAEVEWAARLPLGYNPALELQALSSRRRRIGGSQR